jgi:hypothetical protein
VDGGNAQQGIGISAISASDTPIGVAGSRGETLVAETLVAGWTYPKKAWVGAMTPILWS